MDASARRHTEGNESDTFVALFADGVSYLPGGVASGLKAPAPTGDPALYRLTGCRQFRLTKVAASGSSLNSGDGFVLSVPGGEEGSAVYQWLGADASAALKYRLLTHAMDLNSSAHGGDAQVRARLLTARARCAELATPCQFPCARQAQTQPGAGALSANAYARVAASPRK